MFVAHCRQCDQVQQKREEKAELIEEITRDTMRLRAKMQSLRDVCGQTTAKAQVRPFGPDPRSGTRPWCVSAEPSRCIG